LCEIGSPNGAAFAYFLMQHKAQLGHKTITKITIFRPENNDDVDFVDASLCFHVGDEMHVAEAHGAEGKRSHAVSRNVAWNEMSMSLIRLHEVHA
jgi:hypothetical protein